MTTDPRLANIELLTLAAMRARQHRQVADWRTTVGISSLVAAAKALPQRDPWDVPDLEPRDGLARLLAEARQWHEEGQGGT